MAFFATASGLTMDRVRSTAMQDLQLVFRKAGQETRLTFYFIRLLPECRGSLDARSPARTGPYRQSRAPESQGRQRQGLVSLPSGFCKAGRVECGCSLFPPLQRGGALRSHALFSREVRALLSRIRGPAAC